jgi:hypothetical protein
VGDLYISILRYTILNMIKTKPSLLSKVLLLSLILIAILFFFNVVRKSICFQGTCPMYTGVKRIITYESEGVPIAKAILKRTGIVYSLFDLIENKPYRSFFFSGDIDQYVNLDRYSLLFGQGGSFYLPEDNFIINLRTLEDRKKFLISKYNAYDENDEFAEIELPFCRDGLEIFLKHSIESSLLKFQCRRQDPTDVSKKNYKEFYYFDLSNFEFIGKCASFDYEEFRSIEGKKGTYGNGHTQAVNSKSNYIHAETKRGDEYLFGKIKVVQQYDFEGVGELEPYKKPKHELFIKVFFDDSLVFTKKTKSIEKRLWHCLANQSGNKKLNHSLFHHITNYGCKHQQLHPRLLV